MMNASQSSIVFIFCTGTFVANCHACIVPACKCVEQVYCGISYTAVSLYFMSFQSFPSAFLPGRASRSGVGFLGTLSPVCSDQAFSNERALSVQNGFQCHKKIDFRRVSAFALRNERQKREQSGLNFMFTLHILELLYVCPDQTSGSVRTRIGQCKTAVNTGHEARVPEFGHSASCLGGTESK